MMTRIFCVVLVAATGVFAQGNAKPDLAALSTALCDAIAKGDVAAAKKAVDSGAKVDIACPIQQTLPLHYAVIQGNIALVKLLLDKGANIKQEDGDSMYTPLHYAAALEDPAIATLLIERGADVNASSEDGSTPLDIALTQKRDATAEVIKKWGGKRGEEDVVQLQPETATANATPPSQSPKESAPQSTALPSRSPDGKLMFKGLYIGMSIEEAIKVMSKLGLPPCLNGVEEKTRDIQKLIAKVDDGTQYTQLWTGGYPAIWRIDASSNGRVFRIYLRGKAVEKMFEATNLNADAFIQGFVDAYIIPEMRPTTVQPDVFGKVRGGAYTIDGPFVSAVEYADTKNGWQIWIDENKDITYWETAKIGKVKFD